MKERPILFSGEMVRALLEGRKTQTRRAMKPQPAGGAHRTLKEVVWGEEAEKLSGGTEQRRSRAWAGFMDDRSESMSAAYYGCPYGQPGDRLWVREAWQIYNEWGDCDTSLRGVSEQPDGWELSYRATHNGPVGQWRPSIHMPRWASRITLEIVSVRVERLQEISSDDETAEGIDDCIEDPSTVAGRAFAEAEHYDIAGVPMKHTPETFGKIAHFNALGLDWDASPWVWVVEFSRTGGRS